MCFQPWVSLSSGVNGTSGSRISQTSFLTFPATEEGKGEEEESKSWKDYSGSGGVIRAYICAASIWTYDGNNLEALSARRTCKPRVRVYGTTSPGMVCSRVRRRDIHRDEYRQQRVCHAGES